MATRRFPRRYPPVTIARPQARQEFPAGNVVFRWYLWMTDRKYPAIAWARTADEASAKRLFVHTVEPAPGIED